MNLKNTQILFSLLITSSLSTSLAMEGPGTQSDWSKDCKVASSAASYVYDISPETDFDSETLPGSLEGYEVVKTQFASEGSIQAVSLYNPKDHTAVVSYRGTKEARDWKANLGIGYCIAKAIDVHDIKIGDKPVRLPDYFGNLAARKLQGLFAEQYSQIALANLDLPLTSLLNSLVTFHPLTDKIYEAGVSTLKHTGAGVAAGATGGFGAGSVFPGVGNLAGALVGAGTGFCYGGAMAIKNGLGLAYEGYKVGTDYKYERSLHLDALGRIVDLSFLQQYTSDSAQFLRTSVDSILGEYESDEKLKLIVDGHSLGRFTSGYAFLDFLGARNLREHGINIERMGSVMNIGFNGPAGFQGLPHLPFMQGQAAQNITSALSSLDDTNRDIFQHIRRQNDLVGSLAGEFDIAQIREIGDVSRIEQSLAQQHFLNNHGIKPIFQLLHPHVQA